MDTEKKDKKIQKTPKKKPLKLDPCDKAHTMETSRPVKDEDACDEGVK